MSEWFDAANASLDRAVFRVANQLERYRHDHDGDDMPFIQWLVRQYVDTAMKAPHGSGAVNMALATYRLVTQQMEIDELMDAVEMRDSGLELMWAMSDYAEEKRDRGAND
jgi:hypothetical protein